MIQETEWLTHSKRIRESPASPECGGCWCLEWMVTEASNRGKGFYRDNKISA